MKKIEVINGKKKVITFNEEVSRTDQSFLKDTDVNNIMQKYLKTGQITHLAKVSGVFTDVSQIPDLLTAMSQVTKAQQAFELLPAALRKRFGNSPVAMVEFLKDTRNDREAIELGLKVRKPGLDNIEPDSSDSAKVTTPKSTQSKSTQSKSPPPHSTQSKTDQD